VAEDVDRLPVEAPELEKVEARDYLLDQAYVNLKRAHVYNFCRSYRYQSLGYYVSLLAEARGHHPLPTITTIQDLKSPSLARTVVDDLDEDIQRALAAETRQTRVHHIVFGRSGDGSMERLSGRLFRALPAPFLQATFRRSAIDREWALVGLSAPAWDDLPQPLLARLSELGRDFFGRSRLSREPRRHARFDLAILHDAEEREPPSDDAALRRFVRAAETVGMEAELIGPDDYGLLPQYDALFIRATTGVNHFTYRFARRAAAEGLVVIDDPVSIFRCCNKVYLAELLARHGVPMPETLVLARGQLAEIPRRLGLPCVLKLPDSSFSQGVVRADDAASLETLAERMLERSDLLIAQRYQPTEFDWRVGILDGRPLFACKYFMARRHWQIIRRGEAGKKTGEGESQTLPVEAAPASVLETASRAARLIGDGLYGVDLKVVDGRALVMEINDNPSIDAGYEDEALGDVLYERIMSTFLSRLERLRGLERRP